jgi:steroid 5-alpha reductase family enzyme
MTDMLAGQPQLLAALCALIALLLLAFLTWVVSYVKRDVSIVDSVWSLLLALAGVIYAATLPPMGPHTLLVMTLLMAWAVRLAGYITWRNWGEPEDRRYQAIRARNQPHFEWKSLYLVFVLQAVLAWIVSLPMLPALASTAALGVLYYVAAIVVVFGLLFETVGDAQLAAFKARPENRGKVMASGLWRYTRHPNYFGEFCVWWGFFLFALAAGAWWTVISPLLMSVLLLKVSGVTLLEQDIAERRPQYRDYVLRTNAFFPGPPKAGS